MRRRISARAKRRSRQFEVLEAKSLLAGDLVGQWRADSLVAGLADQAQVASWPDAVAGITATATGQPILAHGAIGGRAAIRFDAANGSDVLRIPANSNPLTDVGDFSVVVAFATSAQNLVGQAGVWFQNSGLVDANNLGFSNDWGVTINQAGKVSAGMGGGFGVPQETIYSSNAGLNDGQLHVATLTRSGSNLSLYVNNVLSASTTQANANPRAKVDVAIGATSSSLVGFSGDIAEVRLYRGQLTTTEASDVYSQLIGYYQNSVPVAQTDSYTFPEDASVFEGFVNATQGVLRNDTDADGDGLTAVVVTPPAHGTLSLSADGSFFYDSEPNYFGTDTFTYAAKDFRLSAPAAVTIQVTPKYDPAVAQVDQYPMLSGTILSVNADSGLLPNDLNPDQANLQTVVSQAPVHGVLNLQPNGAFDYDPQGYAGQVIFAYQINDGTTLSNAATVTIVINTPPEARDDSYQANEDAVLITGAANRLVANDFDAEGNALTVTLVSNVAHGTLTLAADGSFNYLPDANFVGLDEFTYKLSDGIDESTIATVRINVNSVNDAPVAVNDSYFGLADGTLNVAAANGVLQNDTDQEASPLTAALVATTSHGNLQLHADGSFTYLPQAGFTGVDTFTYRTSDGVTQSAIATAAIAINSLEQQQQILINEVHIHPDIKTELVEFIELHNRGTVPIDVSGWSLRSGLDYVFPAGSSVAPGGYLVVSENPADFSAKFARSVLGPWAGKLSNSGETLELWTVGGQQIDEVSYQLGFPWPTYGDEPGPSIQLINPALDNDLGGSWRGALPTPGEANSVLAANAPPQMRQVNHSPEQPQANEPVIVTARITDPDGVQSVNLNYQLVNPGDYISLTDARYATQWTSLAMRDDGQGGDTTAQDGIFTVTVPGELQTHRRLVRYRITATDTRGAAQTGPYADDPQPNFAYFVYNGVPDWNGAARPGQTAPVNYESELLESLPVYHLITTRPAHVDSQFIPNSTRGSGYGGSDYLWEGSMVYDGVVYDHLNYRSRGGVWRYAMGKNMWKFDFERGHSFEARDNYGEKYDTSWDKLNFSSIIQQGDYLHRGEQGLFESVGFELFNLAGVAAPNTHYVHFRIIESAAETGATQYDSDFQGLYLAIEQLDGNFLDEHELPDGNFYKIENYAPESTANQGATEVDDGSDVRAFINAFRSRQPGVDYWNANVDVQAVYAYQTIAHGIHHYDTQDGKNYYYYHNPETGKWSIQPWDLDLTWADNMYGGEGHPLNLRLAKFNGFNTYTNPANVALNNRFNADYQNKVRELLDLVYNPEQTGMLIDQMASFVYQPGQVSFVDADRAMWDYNPIIAQASRYTNGSKNGVNYKYYARAATKDYPGMMKIMKDYVVTRTSWLNRTVLTNEANVPHTPDVTYAGSANYPANGLTFNSSDFSSPIGATFAGMKWRIAEVTDPNAPGFNPFDRTTDRSYEGTALWESDVMTSFDSAITIPGHVVEPGKTYRVRVRMLDNDNHWSHWSAPVQFAATAAVDANLAAGLRISEVNYNPAAATGAEAAAGFSDNNDFEFIELVNVSNQTLNLQAATLDRIFADGEEHGIEFSFADADVTSLAPGERLVVVENREAFALRYGDSAAIAGEWTGRLSNSAEKLTLSAYGTIIQQFTYDDGWHPTTDGDGATLEIIDPAGSDLNLWNQASGWRASRAAGGSPGSDGEARVPGDANHDGIFNSSDLVLVFQVGKYEDAVAGNASWEEGDWDGDGDFTTQDFVFAFSAGSYSPAATALTMGALTTDFREDTGV